MKKTKIIPLIFIVVVLLQLYVPFKMIWDNNDVLKSGKEFKFITMPIDPNDPLRGKYITLSYSETRKKVARKMDFVTNEKIYVVIENDSKGFAKINSISKEKPSTSDFIFTKISYINYDEDSLEIFIDYPFNRFYMEESKAPNAEKLYNETIRDTSKTTYGLVAIKDGEAVLKDVCIDGVSIKELVKK